MENQNLSLNETDLKILREKLDYAETRIDFDERVKNDPLQFPKRYSRHGDIEAAGLVAAVMAMGKVELIIRNLENIFSSIDGSVTDFVDNLDSDRVKRFDGIKYRLYSTHDILTLLWSIGQVRAQWGSIESLFLKGYNAVLSENDGITKFYNGLQHLSQTFKEIAKTSPFDDQQKFSHFFPQPSKKSACKRLCLYTRWMVRTAKPDLGIWKNVNPAHLVIPVDTHISRIGRYLGFTAQKGQGSWKMAVEITRALSGIDPDDPLRLDFPLCHLGISGICPTRFDEEKCKNCGLKEICLRK